MLFRHTVSATSAVALISALGISACHHPSMSASAPAHPVAGTASAGTPASHPIPSFHSLLAAPTLVASTLTNALLTKPQSVATARAGAPIAHATTKVLPHDGHRPDTSQHVAKPTT